MFQNYPRSITPLESPLEYWMKLGAVLESQYHFRLQPHHFKSQFLFSLPADFYPNGIFETFMEGQR